MTDRATAAAAGEQVPALAGFRIGLTATRRVDELATLIERRGGQVVRAPAMRLIPLADDTELAAATRECIDQPPDILVSMTGVGVRAWLSAAEEWELKEPLLRVLAATRLIARGPKSRAAFRAAGLPDAWTPASESSAGVLEQLLTEPLAGRRIGVQLHGEPQPDFVEPLRAAGADVVEVPVYRWTGPDDPAPLAGLVAATCAGDLDAVTFTSGPAAVAMLGSAETAGRLPELVTAFRHNVVAACVGPVTAAPLAEHDVPTVVPERFRLGNLVRLLGDELPRRARLQVAGLELQARGEALVLAGEVHPVGRPAVRLLRALARSPGEAVAADAAAANALRSIPDLAELVRADDSGYRLAARPDVVPQKGSPS